MILNPIYDDSLLVQCKYSTVNDQMDVIHVANDSNDKQGLLGMERKVYLMITIYIYISRKMPIGCRTIYGG